MPAGTRFTYDGGAVQVAASAGDTGNVLAVSSIITVSAATCLTSTLNVLGTTNLVGTNLAGLVSVTGSLTLAAAGGSAFVILASTGGTSVAFGVSVSGLTFPTPTSSTSSKLGLTVYFVIQAANGSTYYIPAQPGTF